MLVTKTVKKRYIEHLVDTIVHGFNVYCIGIRKICCNLVIQVN